MAMQQTTFDAIAGQIRVGDVLVFGGHGLLSRIVKRSSGGAPVSHAASILAVTPVPIVLVESTVRLKLHPTYGVGEAPAGTIVTNYPGEVWLLPLSDTVREQRFDEARFVAYLRSKIGGVFDVIGGLKVIIDEFLDNMKVLGVVELSARLESFFCTELVAAALREAGTAPNTDPAWVSPHDLCRWNVYTDDYYHLRGDVLEIPDYNSAAPDLASLSPSAATAALQAATTATLSALR